MKDNNAFVVNDSSRREFLKKAGLAALPFAGINATADAASSPHGKQLGAAPPFIRMRHRMNSPGWDYIRVKTAANRYPVRDDEQEFMSGLYGGDSAIQWKATGRFRTEKVNDRWWLVDPEGHPFISRGLNCIRPGMSEETKNTVAAMGGSSVWKKKAIQMVQEAGFNTAGYWSTTHFDNAWSESFMSTLKREMLQGGCFENAADARLELFEYIDGYYNHQRKHSSIGYLTPNQFEDQHNHPK